MSTNNTSKIEQLIEEIEDFIDGCKPQPLSNTKIIVNKDQFLELITELKLRTPDEIKKYQSIIRNRDEILAKAQSDAAKILQDAKTHTNELVNESEVVQQAYLRANEILQMATQQAQEIVDAATMDANNIRMGAIQYTDDMLADTQNIIADTLESAAMKYDSFQKLMVATYERIRENRSELLPQEESVPTAQNSSEPGAENYERRTEDYE
ncbi:MAG: ATPase [Lachnospiraceae bacterium]|nr:ATPase [Lachnospiraceae bacterium]